MVKRMSLHIPEISKQKPASKEKTANRKELKE
jgi:hypothetical protein